MQTPRYAIYFAPSTHSPLWRLGCDWMAGKALTQWPSAETPSAEAFSLATRSAQRYGFHATLKAPMRLAVGQSFEKLASAVEAFAAQTDAVEIGKIEVQRLNAFLALVPANQSAALGQLAASVVMAFDDFREPMTAEERRRRVSGGLSQPQMRLLEQYGYPYVLDEFRMHMTLTDRLTDDALAAYHDAAKDWFAPVLETVLYLDNLAIFEEAASGAPFKRVMDFELKGAQRGKE